VKLKDDQDQLQLQPNDPTALSTACWCQSAKGQKEGRIGKERRRKLKKPGEIRNHHFSEIREKISQTIIPGQSPAKKEGRDSA